MVINIGWAKDGRWDDLMAEIKAVKEACGGLVLKVIIETCLLTEEEKVRLCQIVSDSGADYIKTSTGFSAAGATRYFLPPGRGGFLGPGGGPSGYKPYRQIGKRPASPGVLKRAFWW